MPIYEYKCPQCNNVFEEWVKCHAHTASCPECQAVAEQIISNTSFVLKGGGWYVTEYGNRKNEAETNSELASTQSKSDAKPKTAKKDTSDDASNANQNAVNTNNNTATTASQTKSASTAVV